MAAFGTRVRKLNEPTRGETGSYSGSVLKLPVSVPGLIASRSEKCVYILVKRRHGTIRQFSTAKV